MPKQSANYPQSLQYQPIPAPQNINMRCIINAIMQLLVVTIRFIIGTNARLDCLSSSGIGGEGVHRNGAHPPLEGVPVPGHIGENKQSFALIAQLAERRTCNAMTGVRVLVGAS